MRLLPAIIITALAISVLAPKASGLSAMSCQSVFVAEATAKPSKLRFLASPLKEFARTLSRLKAPAFSASRFEEALRDYNSNGELNLRQPRTREEKLALLSFISQTSGRSPSQLETWAQRADPKALSSFVNSLGKLDLQKGFSPTQVDALFGKIVRFGVSDPRSISNLRKIGMTGIDDLSLEQWATHEIASHSAIEAFTRLGLIREQGLRQRLMDSLRQRPNIHANITLAATMIIETFSIGKPITMLTFSNLAKTRLDPAIMKLIETKGFDAALPALKAKYGHLARYDQRIYWARRFYSTAMMSYVLYTSYPSLMNLIIPPGVVDKEAGVGEVLRAVFGYYRNLLGTYVDYISGKDGELPAQAAANVKKTVQMKVAIATDDTKVITSGRDDLGPSSPETTVKKKPTVAKQKNSSDDDALLGATLDQLNDADFSDSIGH